VQAKRLPWYAEEKLASGAFSSILCLEFAEESRNRKFEINWKAVAFGDSCLVQIREDTLVAALPLEKSSAFSSRPHLLSSISQPPVSEATMPTSAVGTCGPDDKFLLITDALAYWFFTEQEAGKKPWNTLLDLETPQNPSFRSWVTSLRNNGKLKNDDMTLVRIEVGV
jgi:hypothetical protein